MKKLILIFLVLTLTVLSGCTLFEPSHPYIVKTSLDPSQVAPDDTFKLIITVKNPTDIEFAPYVLLKYDDDQIRYQYYYSNKRVELEPVPDLSERSYLLEFNVQRSAEAGTYPIDIFVFGGEETKESLDYEQESIDIVSVVR